MDKKRATTLIKRIAKALAELERVTDVSHISAYTINGNIAIDDYTNIGAPKFSYYKCEYGEDITINE